MKAGYRVSEGGVVLAPPAEHYQLVMRHRTGRDLRADSTSFDALLHLREQLIGLGYMLVRLERQPS